MAPCPCKNVSCPSGLHPSPFISFHHISFHNWESSASTMRNLGILSTRTALRVWMAPSPEGAGSAPTDGQTVHPEILHTSLNHRSPHFKNNLLDRKYVLANIFPLALTPWPHVFPVWSTLETTMGHRTSSDNTVKRLFHVSFLHVAIFKPHLQSFYNCNIFLSGMVHLNELSLSKATSLQKITSQTEHKTTVSMHKVNKTLVSCKCL